MRTMILIITTFVSPVLIFSMLISIDEGIRPAYSACDKINDRTIVCNEQYNARSNTYYSTTLLLNQSSTNSADDNETDTESESSSCSSMVCKLAEDYLPNYDEDVDDTTTGGR